MNSNLFLSLFVILVVSSSTASTNLEPTLAWVQNFGSWSNFRGAIGQPQNWISQPPHFVQSEPKNRATYRSLGHSPRTNLLYWTDQSQPGIVFGQTTANTFKWTNDLTKTLNTSSNIKHFTVDWTTDNIYFIDAFSGAISVLAEVKGHAMVKVIHALDMGNLSSITCDSVKGLMFWTDASTRRIEISVLNGDGRRTLFGSSFVSRPSAISIAKHGETRLFWVDEGHESIMAGGYDGSGPQTLFSYAQGRTFRGIAAFEEFIFLTNESSLSVDILRASDGSGKKSIILDAYPYDILILTENDPTFKHECDDKPCDHFCLNIGQQQGECVCAHGFYLALDGVSCEESDSKFIFSSPEKLLLAVPETSLPKSSPNENLTVALGLLTKEHLNATFIDFSLASKIIFWGDETIGSIYSMNDVSEDLKSYNLGKMWEITAQQTTIEGLALNWLDSLLVWIDGSVKHIMASKFDGAFHSIFTNGLEKPRALAVDPLKGVLYWSQERKNSSREIVFMSFHGNRTTQNLCRLDHKDVGDMVLDVRQKKMYWSDPFTGRVFVMQLDTKLVAILNLNINYLQKFTVIQNIIVATNPSSTQPAKQPLLFFAQSNKTRLDPRGRVQFLIGTDRFEQIFADAPISGDVVVYGNYLQPREVSGTCSSRNPCQQICVSSTDVPVCRCAIGFKENGDRCHTEILTTPAIYFVDMYHRQIYQVSSQFSPSPSSTEPLYDGIIDLNSTFALHHLPLIRPTQFLVDGNNGLVYILELGQIKVSDVANQKLDIIYPSDENKGIEVNITQMTLATTENVIYLTDTTNGIIAEMNLATKQTSVWKKQLVSPFAIAVDGSRRTLYWSEGGDLNSAHLDSPDNITHHTRLSNITSLDLKPEENVMYMADIQEGSVLLLNLSDGIVTRIYQSQDLRIFKVASSQSDLYFTCWNRRGVYVISNVTHSNKVQLLTAAIFSRIVHIVFVRRFVPRPATFYLKPIIIGASLALFALLLLLLLLLLLCLCQRRKKQPETDQVDGVGLPPVTKIQPFNGMKEEELLNISNDKMFYPRMNTISIIPSEWESQGFYQPLSELETPATAEEFVGSNDQSAILPLAAASPVAENSRDLLLMNRTRDPRRSLGDLTDGMPPTLPGESTDAGIAGGAVGTGIAVGASSSNRNSIFNPEGASSQHPGNPDLSADALPGSESVQPLNLAGPEKGQGGPTGRFVNIPPKLHTQPRGFAPASHNVPAAVKNTWGRMKKVTRPALNDNSHC